MKQVPYLLLIMAFLIQAGGDASAETMAERKQRIMRKYLRERQNVVQSDLVIPEIEEDERVTESRKFSQPEIDLRPQRSTLPAQAPPMARAVPLQAQQNWLLEEDKDAGMDDPYADPYADPYGDPFALDKSEDRKQSAAERWAEWKLRQEEMAAEKESDAEESSWYGSDRFGGQSGYGQRGYGQRDYSYGYQRDESSRSFYGSYPRTTEGSQSDTGLGSFGTTRYGSSPSSGMLQWSTPSSGAGDDPAGSATGYTPYRSPYQTRQEQRQQQSGYPRQEEQDFTWPTPYQKWKNNNQGWDPTADDAYVNELMQRNRR